MNKITIKVKKPFPYAGKRRKVDSVLTVPEKHAEALILVGNAERYVEQKPKRTYRTRRASPTQKAVMKAEDQVNN